MNTEPMLADLSALYPADVSYWKNMKMTPLIDTVWLSLGIEPRSIAELVEMHQPVSTSISAIYDRDNESNFEFSPLSYGVQEQDYNNRISAVRNAIAGKSLTYVEVADGCSDFRYLDLTSFVIWAKSKGWVMPEWMMLLKSTIQDDTLKIAGPTITIRERKKSSKLEEYTQWQSKADQLHAEHPDWSKSHIARVVAIGVNRCANTVRHNISLN